MVWHLNISVHVNSYPLESHPENSDINAGTRVSAQVMGSLYIFSIAAASRHFVEEVVGR